LLLRNKIRFPARAGALLLERLRQGSKYQDKFIDWLKVGSDVDVVGPKHIVGAQDALTIEPNFCERCQPCTTKPT
jgi:hypothetical protein